MNVETINSNFEDDPSVMNLEVGAGCGDFGKVFFPKCYSTTLNEDSVKNCPQNQIDYFCDAHHLPWKNCRFSLTIICNPFFYGFLDADSTKKLMDEMIRVLHNGGEIMVLENYTNKYFRDIKDKIKNYVPNSNQPIEEIFVEVKEINPTYAKHKFYQVNGRSEVKPTHQVLISIKKNCHEKSF